MFAEIVNFGPTIRLVPNSSIQFVEYTQEFATMNSARRGSTKVGIATRMWITSER